MIKRLSENLLLRPQDLKPLRDGFTVIGVFNPAAIRVNEKVVLLARVAEKPLDQRPGYVALPRWKPNGKIVVDWASEDELARADPRVVRRKSDNFLRLTSLSHLRVFWSPDSGSMEWTPGRVLLPDSPMEDLELAVEKEVTIFDTMVDEMVNEDDIWYTGGNFQYNMYISQDSPPIGIRGRGMVPVSVFLKDYIKNPDYITII